MGINQGQPRTFLRDDIRIVLEDRRITVQHSLWTRRRKPDVVSLEDIKTIHAVVEEPWVLSLIIVDVRGKLHLVDEKMSGWEELLERLPKLLDGFNAEAVTETQRYLRNPLLCWGARRRLMSERGRHRFSFVSRFVGVLLLARNAINAIDPGRRPGGNHHCDCVNPCWARSYGIGRWRTKVFAFWRFYLTLNQDACMIVA